MPELPEVEIVRRGLAARVAGALVTGVDVLDARTLRRHGGPPEDFVARLNGMVLGEPARRGKFLWVPLGPPAGQAGGRPEIAVVMHLGMSGQVLLREPGDADARHTRVRIHLDTGAGARRIDFADQRIIGAFAIEPLVPFPASVAHIALDPLDPSFDDRDFVRRLRMKRTEVKRALLDQTLVSGNGNIYADEALWGARVHPRQPTETISAAAAGRLIREARAVMERALAEGGTSFDQLYVNVNGQSGYFSRSLRAYAQTGRPCERCGRPIVRERFMGRSSHYCEHCQRIH